MLFFAVFVSQNISELDHSVDLCFFKCVFMSRCTFVRCMTHGIGKCCTVSSVHKSVMGQIHIESHALECSKHHNCLDTRPLDRSNVNIKAYGMYHVHFIIFANIYFCQGIEKVTMGESESDNTKGSFTFVLIPTGNDALQEVTKPKSGFYEDELRKHAKAHFALSDDSVGVCMRMCVCGAWMSRVACNARMRRTRVRRTDTHACMYQTTYARACIHAHAHIGAKCTPTYSLD